MTSSERYGGEEFLLILPECCQDYTNAFAERLRLAICSQCMDTSEGIISVTVSLGVAQSGKGEHGDAEALVRAQMRLCTGRRNRAATVWKLLSKDKPPLYIGIDFRTVFHPCNPHVLLMDEIPVMTGFFQGTLKHPAQHWFVESIHEITIEFDARLLSLQRNFKCFLLHCRTVDTLKKFTIFL